MEPTIFSCTACSKAVVFSHPETTVITCSCGAVLNKKEGGFLLEKPFPIIQNPTGIIQPGTTGMWQGNPFRVLGRLRVWTGETVWNYWTVLLADNSLAYLGEGYGLYAMYSRTQIDLHLAATERERLQPGNIRSLRSRRSFLLERHYKCRRWDIEGEILLPECDAEFSTLEFADTAGNRLELIAWLQNFYQVFEVIYISFEALQLTNTRPGSHSAKTIVCTTCNESHEVKGFPYAQSFGCPKCSARYVLKPEGDFKKLSAHKQLDGTLEIQLGTQGTFDNVTYEVIGFTLKEEVNQYQSRWKEYTLWNEAEGFAFLSLYNGHWVFIKEKGDAPVLVDANTKEFTYDGEAFQLYNKYLFQVIDARGSFSYNIFNDGHKEVREYISPPELWTKEQESKEGIKWFLGYHISDSELGVAFDGNVILPYKDGIGAVEPKGYINQLKLIGVSVAAALLLLLVHFVTSVKQEKVVLNQTFTFPDSSNTVSYVSPVMRLGKGSSNMLIDVAAPVSNSWVSVSATLVNTVTGTEYSIEQGVEYYTGYEGGEYWSEGDRSTNDYLDKIPAGDYVLQLEGLRASPSIYGALPTNEFYVTATYDVPTHRNLLIGLVALLIWPVIQYMLTNHYERKRWYNSPFSPYEYED